MRIAIACLLFVALMIYEWRRRPARKLATARDAELEADANDALKAISKLARKRAQERAIPVPIMPEETTDVIVLHPREGSARQVDAAATEQRREHPGQYRIVRHHRK